MKKSLFLLTICSLVVVACTKLKEDPAPDSPISIQQQQQQNQHQNQAPGHTNYPNPGSFFQANVPKMETKVINIGNQTVQFISSGGTNIKVPAGSLVDANGNTVTGNVVFKMKEYLNKSSMIYSGVTTYTDGGTVLKSGGMIDLSATANNQAVLIKQGSKIEVTFPGPVQADMEGYIAVPGDNHNKVVWKLVPGMRLRDPANMGNNTLAMDKFNLVNLDRVMHLGKQTEIEVNLPKSCDYLNSKVYIVFKKHNAVCYLMGDPYSKNTFGSSGQYTVPLGEECQIVVCTIRNNVMQYAIKDVVISENHVENITHMKDISEASFKSLMESF